MNKVSFRNYNSQKPGVMLSIKICTSENCRFLPNDEAVASETVIVIVSRSDGRAGGTKFATKQKHVTS